MDNLQYLHTLPSRRRHEYRQSLFGGGSVVGCAAYRAHDLVARLSLPDGGQLGEDFGKAVHDARSSPEYKAWEHAVVRCLARHRIHVDGDDLESVQQPFLLRLLRLAHAKYSIDDRGDLHYDLDARDAINVSTPKLRALHSAEMRAARRDLRCREVAGDGAQRALDAASSALVARYPSQVLQLRTAMDQVALRN